MLSKDLLDVLACPKCKGSIKYDKKAGKLICNKCRLKYGIIGDIPNMLIYEAKKF